MVNKLFLYEKDLVEGKNFYDYQLDGFRVFKQFSYPTPKEAVRAHIEEKSVVHYHLIVYNDGNKKFYLKDYVGAKRLEQRLKSLK